MLPDELNVIQKATQAPYVTVIIPLQGTAPEDKKVALLQAEKAMGKTGDFLRNMYPQQADLLLNALQTLLDRFARDYDPTAEGIGLYVSPGYSKLVKFFFPVHEKVLISDAFAIRELLYLEHYAIGYYVLQINQKTVHCYRGRLNNLEEIRDGIFPRYFQDDYEYSKPAKITTHSGQAGVKGFERDKSVTKVNRLRNFYRETDQLLTSYLGELPLVIVGPQKDISLLQELTRHKKSIIATVNGNYANAAIKSLEEHIWPSVKSWIDEKEQATMLQLLQEKWRQHAVEGIRDVWAGIKEDRGGRLIVEKDYTCPGFLDIQTGKLHLKAPKHKHHIVIDAVDEILRLAIKKGGEIRFVKNGKLNDHGHIALITRY